MLALTLFTGIALGYMLCLLQTASQKKHANEITLRMEIIHSEKSNP